jgi:hypothetical protein
VPCTEQHRGAPHAPATLRHAAAWLALCVLSACQTPAPQPAHAPAPPTRVTPAPAPAPAPVPSGRAARSADEYKRQMALRLVAANPKTYTTRAPDVLLAIPILEVEVNADGSVRHITVVRVPTQATDTVQLAIDAVKRAAPFGDVTQVPKPWKFMQVFLFDDDRRFKPKVLD